ncbi:hypothetical protein CKAH01_11876 [Colletotrichum kahawae]|uniref:C2H2-type domain-containing protein n=1 Tax=Colletotrichum kahawae TaxID=34407 RepID=A0AAE0DFV5_COLKA|nr:hypothetical protein CKAH01_11876 [Colletotrichum kahawae]
MEPFVHNPQYAIVICRACQFAVVADEVLSHLRTHHREIAIASRAHIAEAIRQIPGIIRTQAELAILQYPDPSTPPIPHIAAPKTDGIRCAECPYMCRRSQVIQRHCRAEHGWQND